MKNICIPMMLAALMTISLNLTGPLLSAEASSVEGKVETTELATSPVVSVVQVHNLPRHLQQMNMGWSPDSTMFAIVTDEGLVVLDREGARAAANKSAKCVSGEFPCSLYWFPDSQHLAVRYNDGWARQFHWEACSSSGSTYCLSREERDPWYGSSCLALYSGTVGSPFWSFTLPSRHWFGLTPIDFGEVRYDQIRHLYWSPDGTRLAVLSSVPELAWVADSENHLWMIKIGMK